jgi:ABC-2 type transport system permease protein
MRNAWLVALREYGENARTKGFWIGLVLFPLILIAAVTVPGWLEKSTPTRRFVLVDQSGLFEQGVERALERLHQREVLRALGAWVRAHVELPAGAPAEAERLPAAEAQRTAERYLDANPETLDLFASDGGIEAALAALRAWVPDDAPAFEEPRRRFERVPLPTGLDPGAPLERLAEELKPWLRGDVEGEDQGLFAALLIAPDAMERAVRPGGVPAAEGAAPAAVQYWSANLADDDLRDAIEEGVNEEMRRREYVARGLDVATVTDVQRSWMPFASLNPKKEAGEEEVGLEDVLRQWAPVGFVYLLWIGIFTISQMLLNNTIEEKSNRIIEVLLSSVTPGELMLGKLVGIAGIGLTMIVAWIGSLVGVLALHRGPEARFANELFEVLRTSDLLPAFALYFLLGYLLYAGVFLALGSLCNTLKEAQNLMGPVTLMMAVPLIVMGVIPKDPNGVIATTLSWIPIYTPFVMMNRAAADPPLFDRVGTLVLLVLSIVAVLWLSARIFRIGILRTGQPPRLIELVRWLRA